MTVDPSILARDLDWPGCTNVRDLGGLPTSDGGQTRRGRVLRSDMLYRLTPTLINEGYVYIAESPLYEITTKDRTYFAYTEPEKAAFLKEIGEKKYTIQRSKGLGENDPEMMWLTTMNPESRRLIKVLPTDVEETARVFDLLLGDNLAGRKEHIAEHGAEYLDDLDVS